MPTRVDSSRFPVGRPEIEYDDPEDAPEFEAMAADARAYAETFRSPPIESVMLAFGVAPIFGLHLVRLAEPIATGELSGNTEVWVVVGDVPFMAFETDDAETPELALRLYCAIAEDWATKVIDGADLAESYPIPVEPTREHAEMLLSRVEFIRDKFVPLANIGA